MNSPLAVILGAGGSVGRALVARLGEEQDVVLVDRLPIRGGKRSLVFDLADDAALSKLAFELPDDIHLVHLAANLDNDLSRLAGTLRDNLLGVSSPLALLGSKARHITYVSSISVYGSAARNPIDEDEPLAPSTPYAIAKASGEMLASGLARMFGVPATIFRPAQMFGLPSARETLPHVLLARMSAGEPMVLSAPPETCRDYVWIGDVASALARQISQPVPGTFNLGSGAPVTFEALFTSAGKRFGMSYERRPTTGGFDQWLKIDRARERLGFAPTLSVLDWISEADPANPFL